MIRPYAPEDAPALRALAAQLAHGAAAWRPRDGVLTAAAGWANEGARAFYESAGFATEQVRFSRAVR
jgi:hypothetical protein